MSLYIEVIVPSIVTVIVFLSLVIILLSRKKFLEGDFKKIIDWIAITNLCFLISVSFCVAHAIFLNTTLGNIFLILRGVFMASTGLGFIGLCIILYKFSVKYGFSSKE